MHLYYRLVGAGFFVVSFAASSFAGPAREIDRNIGRVLAGMHGEEKAALHDVPLGRESLDTLEIEPMQIWAKDAKILAYGPAGEVTQIAPPDVKYFKGRIRGEKESIVFFSRSANGAIRGMVLLGDRRWVIRSGVRKGERPSAAVRTEYDLGAADPAAPLLISEIDELDDLLAADRPWECGVDTYTPGTPVRFSDLRAEATGKRPVSEAGNIFGAAYQFEVAIETDNELCDAFGNNTTSITTYICDLMAKVALVYLRDLNTTVTVGQVNLRTGGAGTDPWTAANSYNALDEFSTYWVGHYPQTTHPRSTAIFLSGKSFYAGVAYAGSLCGDYGFAFNSSLSTVLTSTPDPTATVNGIEYGIPAGEEFFVLYEVIHELGHNTGSPHSSCVGLTESEKALYGVTRNYVDLCLNTECYSGPMSPPVEKGTVMSYCHSIANGRQSRYLFGKLGEPSEKMLVLLKNALEVRTANPAITIQAQPVSCSAGRTASVATCAGCTYAWQIAGGTITSSATSSSITYTPADPEVTLTVTVLSARGCGITAPKAITTSCAGALAPANVVATATSTSNVEVTWTAAAGAVSYNVYRSAGAGYALAGSPVASPFNDGGRAANTAYLYKVRAVNVVESPDSNVDLATTVIFLDDPLAVPTAVQAAHITQLRTAIHAVRMLASLGAGTYTDPALTANATLVKAVHLTDLRTAINAARSSLTLSALSYADTITASTTPIKASHLTELRNGVK